MAQQRQKINSNQFQSEKITFSSNLSKDYVSLYMLSPVKQAPAWPSFIEPLIERALWQTNI